MNQKQSIESLPEIDFHSKVPIYKQLLNNITALIETDVYKAGDILPSMNKLSAHLDLSKETIKKVYGILQKKELIQAIQGKGFFVSKTTKNKPKKVLLLLDKLSTYKSVIYQSFVLHSGNQVSTTIHLHNQSPKLFQSLLEENLDLFDYYIITPHFPLDSETQSHILTLIRKIPNRKLILLDKNLPKLKGNFGAIYQNFEDDSYYGLSKALKLLRKYERLHTIASQGSLYSSIILQGVNRFCREFNIPHKIHNDINLKHVESGGVYFVLNSQLDNEIIELVKIAKSKKLKIGKDIGIISYNESPINEIILDGLTVVSTDFKSMGKQAADMVISGNLFQKKNEFELVIRKTL
jgi:DNA-binding transcriptional regulator YhcF (GntR family)